MKGILQKAGVYHNETILTKSIQLSAYADDINIIEQPKPDGTVALRAIEHESYDRGLAVIVVVSKPYVQPSLISRRLNITLCISYQPTYICISFQCDSIVNGLIPLKVISYIFTCIPQDVFPKEIYPAHLMIVECGIRAKVKDVVNHKPKDIQTSNSNSNLVYASTKKVMMKLLLKTLEVKFLNLTNGSQIV